MKTPKGLTLAIIDGQGVVLCRIDIGSFNLDRTLARSALLGDVLKAIEAAAQDAADTPRVREGQPNPYEAKQEARRERMERRAAAIERASSERFEAARSAVAGIEPGQPILVGHHSEKRHRRALERHDQRMRKAFELREKAQELARRAGAVGTGGISSDDPEAVDKLGDKVETLERRRDHMKLVNALYRKGDAAGLAALGLDLETLRRKVAAVGYSWVKAPYESWQLTNLGARIRDAKKRAERITQQHERAAAEPEQRAEQVGHGEVIQDYADNRVLLRFPSRLSRDDYKTVRSHGFVWSPTRNAFVRKLTAYAVDRAQHLARTLGAPAPENTDATL